MDEQKEKKVLFNSLRMKLVLVMVLLVVSVMAVAGSFLINSITNFYIGNFREQVASVFDQDTIGKLDALAKGENAEKKIKGMLEAYATSLGINRYRNYYILDGKTGAFLTGSNESVDQDLSLTSNILSAMAGEVGNSGSISDDFMDVAIPVGGEERPYIIYIRDNKAELADLNWTLVSIVVQAILFGLLTAILLSIILSKTITNPIEKLKVFAQFVSKGEFGHKVEAESTDEIGDLAVTFNKMADKLQETMEEIQSERDKLNTLFSYMTDGVAAFTGAGTIIHMNYAAEKLLDITFQEEMTFDDVFRGIPIPEDISGGQQIQLDRDGRAVSILFAPYGDGGIITMIRDVTEQKKLDDSRKEFVANVSHELRTPLTNIKSYTETILDAGGELPPETTVEFLNIVSGEADRMTRIVKDLLTLSRLDYGRMDMKFSEFSIKDVLNKVYQSVLLEAEKEKQQITLTVDDIPTMNGDRDRIEQVIVNIVSNAMKYTPKGGTIEIFGLNRDKNHITVKVKDNGIGIPEKDAPRLFERFYRVDKARSRKAGGTGLGLAIAKEIVEIHKGTIHLDSKVDEGTTITIVLPTDLPLLPEEDIQNERKN